MVDHNLSIPDWSTGGPTGLRRPARTIPEWTGLRSTILLRVLPVEERADGDRVPVLDAA